MMVNIYDDPSYAGQMGSYVGVYGPRAISLDDKLAEAYNDSSDDFVADSLKKPGGASGR